MKIFERPIKPVFKLLCLTAALGLAACDPGQPSSSDSGNEVTGAAEALSQSEFNSLSPSDQYAVASKLYGTFFRGISADDFFDMSAGNTTLVPKSRTFLSDTRYKLRTTLSIAELTAVDTLIEGFDDEGNPDPDLAKYSFDNDSDANENEQVKQLPLARIKEYPVSRDLYVQWMAYFLSNTIMYSPAVEMESTDYIDAQNMYRFLTTSIRDGSSVRQMVGSNLPSLRRWRVSRSSENHALEAYELYLGLFETEEDSVKGGIACKDFYLTDEDSGYVLSTTTYPNTEPQLILGSSFITTCDDLYEVISGHPLVMPRAVEVLVNYMYSGRSREDRVAIINSIVSSGAESYEDIFTAIIFSREYLLKTERPRSFEESLMPLLDSLKWSSAARPNDTVGERIFENIASSYRNSVFYLGNKGWHSMMLKIGRLPDVPLDALSFANYHKGVREQLLLNETSYNGEVLNEAKDENGEVILDENNEVVHIPGLIYDGTGDDAEDNVRADIAALTPGEYIDLLFLNTLQRKASVTESDGLISLFDGLNYLDTDVDGVQTIRTSTSSTTHDEIAEVTFDYISRLPEFYYFKAIN